jgi:pyridoxamine 5'-phosphate oxidase family protein
MKTFTDAELAYLSSQRLGRLATVDAHGAPQNNPVGFRWNAEAGTVDIHGLNLGASRKFRNVGRRPEVSLVVDDLASVDPWQVRGVEVRGRAEALTGQKPPVPQMSGEVIRIHPRRVISWNVDPANPAMQGRDVADADAGAGRGARVAS